MFYNIKKFFLYHFSELQFFKFPMFILWGNSHYKIKGHDQRQILNLIKPGDILLRRYDRYVSGLMIPGYFTHSAIYVGDNDVVHMLKDGIMKEDILTFMRCDNIAILRNRNELRSSRSVELAKEQYVNKVEYDFEFDFDDKGRMSCTELCSFCYDNPPMEKKKSYIIPDDFLNCPQFYSVWRKK